MDASQHDPVMRDPLFDAVDRLSALLKHLWELRRNGDITKCQAEALDRLVDETVASIMSLIRSIRETGSSHGQLSTSRSAAVRRCG
jgi:hypothetical protein